MCLTFLSSSKNENAISLFLWHDLLLHILVVEVIPMWKL